MENPELIKNTISVIAPLISTITELFIKPKIKDLADKANLKIKNFEHVFENKFTQYLISSYEKHSVINTIVFHNQQKLLKELYVPLTVTNKEKNVYVIENFENDFIPLFHRVLITDTAGMGKTTILKRIFLSIIDEGIGIPVLIELRRLSKSKDIVDEIIEQLSTFTDIIDKEFVLQLIQRGDFIFLFDGFDEIPLKNRKIITKQIQFFVNKASNNYFVLSSRPEAALSSFGDFKEFKIKPLEKTEAFSLIEKYDNKGVLSKQLIKKLDESYYKNVSEFLTNPLLVSLLFAAFEYKNTIPLKKHIFYRQVYDALFESHDLTKGDSFVRNKSSKLDIEEFHKILRHVGYNCLIKDKIEFTKDEIINLIKEAKEFSSNLDFKVSTFLNDLVTTVPLFKMDGIYYKWSHKSLQEYFAAQFIFLDAKDARNRILTKISKHKNIESYLNLLDIYYSIDYDSFRKTIIYSLLNEYFKYLKGTYHRSNSIYKRERQDLTFGYDYLIIKEMKNEFDDVSSDDIWKNVTNSQYAGRNWSMTYTSSQFLDKNFVLRVPVSVKPCAKLMLFLKDKNEPFIKSLHRSVIYKSSIPFGFIRPSKLYFVSDDVDNILNSKDNFKITNDVILSYSFNTLVSIDEIVGLEIFNKIKDSSQEVINNKLLDF